MVTETRRCHIGTVYAVRSSPSVDACRAGMLQHHYWVQVIIRLAQQQSLPWVARLE
jgi:hypothetical protein